MDIIVLTKENMPTEHLCCAISSKATEKGVEAKKEWLTSRIDDGLRFKKLNARGKVFIEYIPAEKAWVPIDANGYMFINCFWVSGAYKGKGYGTQLLAECENDARNAGCKGVAITVGSKKRPFLSDKTFMIRQGYEVCDWCPPYFELLVKRFDNQADLPKYKNSVGAGMGKGIRGIDIFYTAQCPFTIPYTELLTPVIASSPYPIRLHPITTREMAQEHICPITTYSLFVDGQFYTQEIQTAEKLKKMTESL